jgi:hypothetical protein
LFFQGFHYPDEWSSEVVRVGWLNRRRYYEWAHFQPGDFARVGAEMADVEPVGLAHAARVLAAPDERARAPVERVLERAVMVRVEIVEGVDLNVLRAFYFVEIHLRGQRTR